MQPPTAVPSGESLQVRFALCAVDARIRELANRLRAPLQEWVEPGLGPAVGFACKLQSGLPLFLEHLLLAPTDIGPIVYVEAATLAQRGVTRLLAEVLPELGLAPSSITWRQPDECAQAAKELAQYSVNRQRGNNDA